MVVYTENTKKLTNTGLQLVRTVKSTAAYKTVVHLEINVTKDMQELYGLEKTVKLHHPI